MRFFRRTSPLLSLFFAATACVLAGCGGDDTSGPSCGNGVRDGVELCDEGGLNGSLGHCKRDCSGIPVTVSVRGDILPFLSEVDGERLSGATVSILEYPDKTVVTGADGHFDFDGLDEGSDVTLVMEHPDYHATQTATITLGAHGIEPFTIQAVSTNLFSAMKAIVGTPLDEDQFCEVASTVTRLGGALYVHLRQGEPGATVSTLPALLEESGPIYFNEAVLPDKKQLSTSKDGGVVLIRVPPGDYTLTASKADVAIAPVHIKCRAGMVVNAGPPLGLLGHVLSPDYAGGVAYPDDVYSASTDALCAKTAACVNAAAGAENYPAVTLASCQAMFKNMWSYVDLACDAENNIREPYRALFDCRAATCELALGGDEACAAEEQVFLDALASYGACYAASHTP